MLKKRLQEYGILFVLLIILVIIFRPTWHPPRENARQASCQSNLKKIALAVAQYKENNDKFPPANNSASEFSKGDSWAGRIFLYTEKARIFQCPSDDNATDEKKTSYGYNARLGEAGSQINNAASIILNYEVQANPNNWTQSGIALKIVSANKRHLDGANYSFADGHVKWFPPKRISSDKPNGQNATFRIK